MTVAENDENKNYIKNSINFHYSQAALLSQTVRNTNHYCYYRVAQNYYQQGTPLTEVATLNFHFKYNYQLVSD